MITNQEIVDTYLAYRNMKLSAANGRDDSRMLVPFYLMDASYQIYCKDIKDLNCAHKLQAARNRWKENYRRFNAAFFMPFNDDQREFIVDQMDEFYDYIHYKIVLLKTTIMNVFSPDASTDEKVILSSVLASNALAQMAQNYYEDMYRDEYFRKTRNHTIECVVRSSYDFAKHFPVSKTVDLTSSDAVSQQITLLVREVISYLKLKFEEEKSK